MCVGPFSCYVDVWGHIMFVCHVFINSFLLKCFLVFYELLIKLLQILNIIIIVYDVGVMYDISNAEETTDQC